TAADLRVQHKAAAIDAVAPARDRSRFDAEHAVLVRAGERRAVGGASSIAVGIARHDAGHLLSGDLDVRQLDRDHLGQMLGARRILADQVFGQPLRGAHSRCRSARDRGGAERYQHRRSIHRISLAWRLAIWRSRVYSGPDSSVSSRAVATPESGLTIRATGT